MPDMNRCEVVVVLDRSGSMQSIKTDMEGGFNRFVADQQAAAGDCVLTLVQFDTQGIDVVHEATPIKDVVSLTLEPRGGTPLLDALGQTITRVGARLAAMAEERRPGRVIVLIITDGEENSSREFTKGQIKTMVERQAKDYQWQFVYLGANVDAFAEAGSLGVAMTGTANYSPDSAGVRSAFAAVSDSAVSYRSGVAQGMTLTDEQRKAMKAH